jgi:CheY-like chemotaxis protein
VNPSAHTVLLVEDGLDLGPLLRETVEEWNHRALLAQTGAEALEVLAREQVSLMLLDHELPDMTGIQVLEALRSLSRAIPPVVLMSAAPRLDPDRRLPEVVEVLRKPFDLEDLAALLQRRLPPPAPLTARGHPFAAGPFPTQHSTGAVQWVIRLTVLVARKAGL